MSFNTINPEQIRWEFDEEFGVCYPIYPTIEMLAPKLDIIELPKEDKNESEVEALIGTKRIECGMVGKHRGKKRAIYRGNDGKIGNSSEVDNGKKCWLPEARKHFSKDQSIKCISYNKNKHSVYLHTKVYEYDYDTKTGVISNERPEKQGSKRHTNYILITYER